MQWAQHLCHLVFQHVPLYVHFVLKCSITDRCVVLQAMVDLRFFGFISLAEKNRLVQLEFHFWYSRALDWLDQHFTFSPSNCVKNTLLTFLLSYEDVIFWMFFKTVFKWVKKHFLGYIGDHSIVSCCRHFGNINSECSLNTMKQVVTFKNI